MKLTKRFPETLWTGNGLNTWMLALLAGMLLTMPGCGGCNSKPQTAAQKAKKKKEDEEKKKLDAEKKKRLPDFETKVRMHSEPADKDAVIFNFYKPGHWSSNQQQLLANNFDFAANLKLHTSAATDQKPLLVDGTLYSLSTMRPAALAKGQTRLIESLSWAPPVSNKRNMMVTMNLRNRRSGSRVFTDAVSGTRMNAHQFQFLALAAFPDNYNYLRKIGSIAPPLMDGDRASIYYRVISPKIDQRIPVPSHPLTWTSVAYVLWDGVNPDVMSPPQQQAMLDWLHWGGQLIISGPGNLDMLKSSFLADYLPVEPQGSVEYTSKDFAEINNRFSLYSKARKEKQKLNLNEDEKLVGAAWDLRPHGNDMPHTGGMVAEGHVGRGRIVVTKFSLAARHFYPERWGSMDNFFNACLMRRPARSFGGQFQVEVSVPGYDKLDSRICSQVRYFSRDLPPLREEDRDSLLDVARNVIDERGATNLEQEAEEADRIRSSLEIRNRGRDSEFEGYVSWGGMGNAGWNDRSGASVAARKAFEAGGGH